MPDLIHFDGVSVRFGPLLAIDNVNLSVRAGEMVALLGPNGAGKSTTLRLATGQIRPTTGRVSIEGREPAAAKSILGVVPDKDNHFEEFTARSNLAFFAELNETPVARINESLKWVELETAADRPVREFSLGMRRRLLLARALLHDPKVLLLDEPLANLDEPGVELVTALLQRARAAGAATLLTSHRADQVKFSDRIVLLDRGQVVCDSPTAQVLKP
jgi:ABC-type multidrug transport system ATPase subunit